MRRRLRSGPRSTPADPRQRGGLRCDSIARLGLVVRKSICDESPSRAGKPRQAAPGARAEREPAVWARARHTAQGCHRAAGGAGRRERKGQR
eukprot:scaffold96866_cov62-Phaeocystis_antarctica.AAC.3